MHVRRCAVLFLESREEIGFDLGELLSGGDGLQRTRRWLALAPHIGEEVEVDASERELLGELSPSQWVDSRTLDARVLKRLIAVGLVIGNGKRHAAWRERDEIQRTTYWHPLGATLHAFTRWSGVDAVQNMKDSGTETAVQLREVLGAPPTEAANRSIDGVQMKLPRIQATDFDRLLARRVTCRNFDPSRALPFELFAQLLQRVFAAQAEVRIGPDTAFLKKNVPSGGGLHPIECYLIVQNVQGVEPGLYHYQAVEHALAPLPVPEGRDWRHGGLRSFLQEMVAQQHWFADAHAVVLLSPRFDRSFWKYRQHAKGYRVVALEAGHLSQTLYLAATEAGLGAFITGAINEKELERAFGLNPVNQGAMAICGFGWRAGEMVTAELDPRGFIWSKAQDRGKKAQ